MSDKPWPSVLEWLSDQTGLPIMTMYKPTGTFTFISPKGRTYTIPEIIDIINETLVTQEHNKYLLIRRARSFTLVPADKQIDPAIVPRIRVQDLDEHGNTEMVSVVLPLTSLVAEDLAPEIAKMKGPFGEVVAMAGANQLVLQDTVGNIKRIYQTIQDIEKNEKGNSESFSHKCVYIKASEAQKILEKLLGDPRDLVRLTQPRAANSQPNAPPFIQVRNGQGGQGRPAQQASSVVLPKIRMHYISADDRTNTVLVTGPADKIALAKDIIKRIDVGEKGQPPVRVGPPDLKFYSLPGGHADAVAKTLQGIYKSASISAAGNNTLIVFAVPEDQIQIAQRIIGSLEKGAKTELIPVKEQDASKIAETLKGMFGDTKSGAPFIEADASRNAIVVHGSVEQVADVKLALEAIGESGTAGSNMRIITIDKGSAATVAEALERLLPQMRSNPVKVIIPGREPAKPQPQKAEPAKKPPADERNSSTPNKNGGGAEEQDSPGGQSQGSTHQLSDPQEKKQPAQEKPGQKNAPITITAYGNRLIVTSNDPAALDLVQKLTRLLTTTPAGKGDFEIIRLKNADATEAAKVLDEAFNGNKQQNQSQRFPFFVPFGRNLPANPSEDRIRVVADPTSNSLLVRASPLDMITIRRLLEKAIDTGTTEAKAVMRTWFIGPLKYANATEVADVIRDVYREHLNNNPAPGQLRGRVRFFGPTPNLNLDANGNPRAVSLAVGVDNRTNSLVVNCSSALHDDIKKLADKLDEAAKDATRTVKVIRLQGVDPQLIQQAIDAIQGRRTTPRSSAGVPSFAPGPAGGTTPGRIGGQPSGNNGNRGGRRPGNTRSMAPPPGPSQPQVLARARGPDFFAQRVKDDPQPASLSDPHHDARAEEESSFSSSSSQDSKDISRNQLAQARGQQPPPAAGADIRGPRGSVEVEALPSGVVVIEAQNAADVEEIIKVIQEIQRLSAGAEVKIELVPLVRADATSVANILTQLFQRVTVGTAGNVANRPQTTTIQTPFGAQAATTQTPGSVVLLPLPRLNAILVAAPQSRMEDIKKEIRRLDVLTAAPGQPVAFPLRKASAARVATLLTNFYAQRYPTETTSQQQIRITHDDSTNTVFVQAAPADLAEIRDLIARLDNTVSVAVNDVRIVPLKNVLADETATLLMQAISQGIVTAPTAGIPGAAGAAGPAGAIPGAAAAGARAAGAAAPAVSGAATKTTSLRFIRSSRFVPNVIESGLLEDIHITPDARINSLIISAPAMSMELLLALVRELDVLPSLRAEVNIFPLKKADATAMALLLQQLFLGTAGVAPTTPGVTGGVGAPGGVRAPGAPGVPGAAGAAGLPSALGAAGAVAIPRQTAPLTLAGQTPEGAPLIELRLAVDQRTNSIIAAGSRNDLDVIEAILSRLEDAEVSARKNEVYHLRNSAAADVALAVTNFLTSSLTVLSRGQQLTPYQDMEREVVVVPEPVSNKLLISATPRYFDEIRRVIEELDAEPPQVVIQALVAEVDLTSSEEFGVEFGLQSPVLFQRSIIPATNFLGPSGTVNFANPGLVPTGVTVNSTINPAALPGFNFNDTGPLGNNPVVNPGIVGFQGLGNLGVGRVSPTSGIGGLVFSAANDTFNLLIRALKTQGRIDILSRPQITTLDNQQSSILIGQNFPIVSGAAAVTLGTITPIITYTKVGVYLQVTPRITPDGKVIMRVHPEVSSVSPTSVNLGNGVLATAINDQYVDTTVTAQDGETVAIGGLISKKDQKEENKIPWLGDLPGIGALFRFRTQTKSKTELLVILTPHIVRSRVEADRVLAEESQRMDWVLADVVKAHGTTGLEPILPPPAPPKEAAGKATAKGPGCPAMPPAPVPVQQAPAVPGAPPGERLPAPRPVPTTPNQGQPSAALPPSAGLPPGVSAAPAMANASSVMPNAGLPSQLLPAANASGNADGSMVPTDQGTESGIWNRAHKKRVLGD